MKNLKFVSIALLSTLLVLAVSSCKKYNQYDNMEVVESSYDGNMDITSGGQDPAGDFWGNNKNGTYSFAWNNPKKKASSPK